MEVTLHLSPSLLSAWQRLLLVEPSVMACAMERIERRESLEAVGENVRVRGLITWRLVQIGG